jgi:hypothetical protein
MFGLVEHSVEIEIPFKPKTFDFASSTHEVGELQEATIGADAAKFFDAKVAHSVALSDVMGPGGHPGDFETHLKLPHVINDALGFSRPAWASTDMAAFTFVIIFCAVLLGVGVMTALRYTREVLVRAEVSRKKRPSPAGQASRIISNFHRINMTNI